MCNVLSQQTVHLSCYSFHRYTINIQDRWNWTKNTITRLLRVLLHLKWLAHKLRQPTPLFSGCSQPLLPQLIVRRLSSHAAYNTALHQFRSTLDGFLEKSPHCDKPFPLTTMWECGIINFRIYSAVLVVESRSFLVENTIFYWMFPPF